MDNFKTFLKYWLPVFIWVVVIFYFSSLPDLKSNFEPTIDFILRKTAHMIEFGILVCLLLRVGFRREKSEKKKFVFLVAILFSLFYAIIDEYHQSFVAGREPVVRDVLIDGIGVVLGSGLYLLFKRKWNFNLK
jgi:VanZ family protein